VLHQKKDRSALSGMEGIIKSCQKTLKKNVGKNPDRETDFVNLVVNPNSFTQTVENMLGMSFLVRNGACELKLDKDGLPKGKFRKMEEDIPQPRQCVVGMNMRQWREMAEAFQVEEGDGIPNRTYEKPN
jgi:hypothetical protein